MPTLELNKTNFESTVLGNDIVFVDFWADWCGPCRSFAPVFDKASADNRDITFAKVNTDIETELATLLQIRSIPTLMVFREKVLLYAEPGALPEKVLNELIHRVRTVDMNEVRRRVAEHEAEASKQGEATPPGSDEVPRLSPKARTRP